MAHFIRMTPRHCQRLVEMNIRHALCREASASLPLPFEVVSQVVVLVKDESDQDQHHQDDAADFQDKGFRVGHHSL
jgi:hypothetical protein